MDFFHSQNQKHTLKLMKHHKKRLTQDQVRLLEINFTSNKKLDAHRKLQLSQELGVPPRKVAIWYQNKRARWKTQSLEFDYSALHIKLENVLAEKRQLEKEVERLRGELERAKQMLRALNQTLPPDSYTSTSCDEVGSSSLQEDVNCSLENGQVLEIDELYACLMGADVSMQAGIKWV